MPTEVDREVYDPYRVEMNQRVVNSKRSSGVVPLEMAANSLGWSPQYWLCTLVERQGLKISHRQYSANGGKEEEDDSIARPLNEIINEKERLACTRAD